MRAWLHDVIHARKCAASRSAHRRTRAGRQCATVTNNTRKPIKLKNVGSTYQKRAGEPYKVRKTLKPGRSVSYTFGIGKGKGKRLTGSFIFDNDSPMEGVLVKTDKGKVRVRCSEGSNAPSGTGARGAR